MKWEYYILQLQKEDPYNIEHIDELGEMGYELVSVDDGIAYFKRPKMTSENAKLYKCAAIEGYFGGKVG